jgi:hypothetical protein
MCEPSQPIAVGDSTGMLRNSLVRRKLLEIADGVIEPGYMQTTAANRGPRIATDDRQDS